MNRELRAAFFALVTLQSFAVSACSSSADGGAGGDDTGTSIEDTGTDTATRPDTKPADAGTDTASSDGGTDTATPIDSATDSSTVDATTDAPTDAPTDGASDTTTTGDTAIDGGTDTATTDTFDATPASIAWGLACTKTSTCAAPTGQTGSCATSYGQPVCTHTCNDLADWSLCEGGNGICVPGGGTTKICTKKCGDSAKTTCGAGASCANLGYRTSGSPATTNSIGVCVPDCTGTGADACAATGTTCDTDRRVCSDVGCPAGCPTGSSCSGSACLPTPTITPLYGTCRLQPTGVSNGCASGLCFALPSPENGFCGTFCNSETGDATCGAGGVCWFDNNELSAAEASDSGILSGPLGNFTLSGGRTQGACLKSCSDTAECPNGFFCGDANGKRACIPGGLERPTTVTAGTKTPGMTCRAGSECGSGVCSTATGYADGLCTRPTTATPCPAGTVAASATSLICTPTCTGTFSSECRSSLVCDDSATGPSSLRCVVGVCRDNADCTAGNVCDKSSAECVPTARTGTAVGTVCTADATCASNFCVPQSTTGGVTHFPGGYCVSSCTILPDFTDTCPNGSFCNAAGIGILGNCFDLCDSTGTTAKFGACRSTYACTPLPGDPRYGVCTSP